MLRRQVADRRSRKRRPLWVLLTLVLLLWLFYFRLLRLFYQSHAPHLTNIVIYYGNYGLGHRLSKMAGAYHVTKRWRAQVRAANDDKGWIFQVRWGSCENSTGLDIFEYLFGTTNVPLGDAVGAPSASLTATHKILRIRNDVPGYFAGQNFKNARMPLNAEWVGRWRGKLASDQRLYLWLARRYQFTLELQSFQNEHDWSRRYIIGLHLRVGNGEKGHFVEVGRNQTGISDFVCDHVRVILNQLAESQHSQSTPLIFVATDTAVAINMVRQCTQGSADVVSYPQPRLAPGQGVSFEQWKSGQQCYDGWKYSMMDMLLLSRVDTLVAPARSTFTQILPLSLLFSGNDSSNTHKEFCEGDGPHLSCFSSFESWLYRRIDDGARHWTHPSYQGTESIHQVHHKVMVHVPDVKDPTIYAQALNYWKNPTASSTLQNAPGPARYFRYGKKVNPEYRSYKNFVNEWIWEKS